MEKPDQCRFCLKLIEPLSSSSIFSEDPQSNPLYELVQKMLSIEFTAENSHICSDCFSMWRMIQDYLHACAEAHKVLLASKDLVVRKPWLENDEEKRMLIGVWWAVKKLYHEMEILLRRVEHPKESAMVTEVARKRKTRKRKQSLGNGMEEEQEVVDDTLDRIKEEEPVEIDDSAAFQSDKPIEATRKVPPEALANEGSDSLTSLSRNLSGSRDINYLQLHESMEEEDDPPGKADDSATIIESKMDYIDLVDSSSEDEHGDEDECDESFSLKTVCQLCGITTSDMASHLENHIKEPTLSRHHESNGQQQMESDNNSSCSSSAKKPQKVDFHRNAKQPKKTDLYRRWRKPKKVDLCRMPIDAEVISIKCKVCGIEYASMLTARLHARSHLFSPVNRRFKSCESNTVPKMS